MRVVRKSEGGLYRLYHDVLEDVEDVLTGEHIPMWFRCVDYVNLSTGEIVYSCEYVISK
jgi:hypothetical protein